MNVEALIQLIDRHGLSMVITVLAIVYVVNQGKKNTEVLEGIANQLTMLNNSILMQPLIEDGNLIFCLKTRLLFIELKNEIFRYILENNLIKNKTFIQFELNKTFKDKIEVLKEMKYDTKEVEKKFDDCKIKILEIFENVENNYVQKELLRVCKIEIDKLEDSLDLKQNLCSN